jgi:hypothetical protein
VEALDWLDLEWVGVPVPMPVPLAVPVPFVVVVAAANTQLGWRVLVATDVVEGVVVVVVVAAVVAPEPPQPHVADSNLPLAPAVAVAVRVVPELHS